MIMTEQELLEKYKKILTDIRIKFKHNKKMLDDYHETIDLTKEKINKLEGRL